MVTTENHVINYECGYERTCSVVPSHYRGRQAIIDTELNYTTNFRCCFDLESEEELYVYGEEHFCILHLPLPESESEDDIHWKPEFKEKKQKEFIRQLTKGISCFPYIHIINLKLDETDFVFRDIRLPGSNIKGLKIDGGSRYVEHMDLYNSTLKGRCEINISKVDVLMISDSSIFSEFNIKSTKLQEIIFKNTVFSNRNECEENLNYYNRGIKFTNCEIKHLKVIDCTFAAYLDFIDTRLESFEAIQCEFYTTPSFLLLKDGITNNITLPQRKDFSFDKHYLMRSFLFDKNNLHNLQAACKKYRQIKRRRILHNEREYKKLRVIYNMAKTNNWYAEQNDYNYLMRRAFERTNIITPVNRFFSKTYRVLSDYGQNIIKPLGYLIFILLLFTLIYMSIDIVNNQDSFFSNFSPNLLVSLKQIISPFQLLLSSSSEEFKSFNTIIKPLFAVLESLISSTLIALFLISLRWNFKRNSE